MKLNEMTDDQRGAYYWLQGADKSFDGRVGCLLNALKRYVKAMGGFVYMPNEDHTQTVLVCEENLADWKLDKWKENYIYALKINEDDDLLMFTEEIFSSVIINWTEEEIKTCQDEDYWYVLDWDCSNAFLHNLQRLTYYLINEEIDEEK